MILMPGSELAGRQTHHGIDLSRLKIIDSATREELPITPQCFAAARQLYGEVIIEVNASDNGSYIANLRHAHRKEIEELKMEVIGLKAKQKTTKGGGK